MRETADAMALVVAETGVSAPLGASPRGHTLVGAIAYCAPTARVWTPGSAEPVLLVDAVVASVQGLECMGEYATTLGATRIEALVIAALGEEQEVRASFGTVRSLGRPLSLAA